MFYQIVGADGQKIFIGNAIDGSLLHHIDPSLESGVMYRFRFEACPVGDLNAVAAAQAAHLGLLDSGWFPETAGDLGRSFRFPRGAALQHFVGGRLSRRSVFWCLH